MPLVLPHSLRDRVRHRFARPGWVVLVEMFIGLGWTRAVVEKLLDPAWWSGDVICDFLDGHADVGVGWYVDLADSAWVPLADAVALVVLALQATAAVCLVSGRHVGLGLSAGMFLNLHFVLAGAVDPSIFYLVCQAALALRLLERHRDDASTELLEWLNLGSIVLVCATAPMVRTLAPAEVIDDPAVVLATFGGLLFLATTAILARRLDRASATTAPAAANATLEGAGARRSPSTLA